MERTHRAVRSAPRLVCLLLATSRALGAPALYAVEVRARVRGAIGGKDPATGAPPPAHDASICVDPPPFGKGKQCMLRQEDAVRGCARLAGCVAPFGAGRQMSATGGAPRARAQALVSRARGHTSRNSGQVATSA